MSAFRLTPAADICLDEIYDYTFLRWGEQQAESYIEALFAEFGAIAGKRVTGRVIPAEFGVAGYFRKWQRHVIYWQISGDGEISIVAILHERMHQLGRLRVAVEGEP